VVSTLCLFLVLGGGAYAAGRLGKDTVGTRQLKRNAVTTVKLKRGAVTPAKLNGAARRALRGATGPPGPPGDPAAIGLGAVGTAQLAPTIPAARVTHDSYQGVEPSNSLPTTLQFNEERYDTANLHDPSKNSRLTAPVSGVYLITANIEWADENLEEESNGVRTLALMRNGKTLIAMERVDASDYNGSGPEPKVEGTVQAIATQALLGAGDFIDVRVGHSQASEALIASFSAISSLETSPEFAMTWLAHGPA
jgi:hypothetical protein